MTPPASIKVSRHPSDLSALTAAFLLVVGFPFSDDAVEYLWDITGHALSPGLPWVVFGVDCMLVVGAAALKWRIAGRPEVKGFLRRLATGWWIVGAGLVVLAHLALIATAGYRRSLGDTATFWVNVLATVAFVTAMAILLFSALSEHTGSRGWLVPLVAGTFVAQIGSALWYPVIEVPDGCATGVSPVYFSQMVQIIPVILLALGIESAYVRRTTGYRDSGRRVAPVLTVTLLVVAELLSFTMLVKAELGRRCGIGAVWHEYISFAVSTQALAIGLFTLLWMLVIDSAVSE